FYVKTPAEMAAAVPESEFPGAIANSMVVADMCDVTLPIGSRKVYQMPELPIPPGRSLAEQLRVQTYQGLSARYDAVDERLWRAYLACALPDEDNSALPLEEALLRLARLGETGRQPKAEGENYDRYHYPHLERFKES